MLADIRVVRSITDLPEAARDIYAYWQRKRGSKHLPARSDIDPIEIPPRILPNLLLVDVVDDERRFVYRLNGTLDVHYRGQNPTGKAVRDGFWGPDAEDALGCYDRVLAERAPIVDPVPYTDEKGYRSEFTLFLPLSDDGVLVNKIIVYSTYRAIENV